eukprot:jgi/Tetstr1/454052/TSEL_040971.t1
MQHYSPASVDGRDSAEHAKRMSTSYSDVYHRTKGRINAEVERLQYVPESQPLDDLWSGSALDERFWRADASFVISRQATGLTREQRSAVERPVPAGEPHPPPGGPAPARFCESTKSRSRTGR